MPETEAIPLQVVSSTVPRTGSAREVYSSGRSGRLAYQQQLMEKRKDIVSSKVKDTELSKLQKDIEKQKAQYEAEIKQYGQKKSSYEKEYKTYKSKFEEAKDKEKKLQKKLEDEETKTTKLISVSTEDMLKREGAFRSYTPQEQQIINREESKLSMSLSPEQKSELLATHKLQTQKPMLDLIGVSREDILTKEKPPKTLYEKGLALDKKKYISRVEKELHMSLSPEQKEQLLESYKPTRSPVWDYIDYKLTSFMDKPISNNLLAADTHSGKYKNLDTNLIENMQTGITPRFLRSVYTEAIVPFVTFPGKMVEPGLTIIKQEFATKGFKKGGAEIGALGLEGADYFTTKSSAVGKTIGEDILAFEKTIPQIEWIPNKGIEYTAPEEPLSEWIGRPTPSFVSAVGVSIGTEFKKDPVKFAGGFIGGVFLYSAVDKALARPFTRIMRASYNVGQGIKTKLGIIKPVYTKATPYGIQAIKVQTAGLTKEGLKTKISNLGYTKSIQGVVTKDTLGREAIPVIIKGRPRMIYLVKSPQELAYSGLNVSKTIKQYQPYLDKQGATQLKKLLTELKTTKSTAQIKSISQKIKSIDTKYGKRLPEVYTKQAKKGFGESFIEQEYYVGRFGPLGTAQRNLYQQFQSTGKAKFLKVGKPSPEPLESSFFLSPYDPITKSILLRKSRLGLSEVPSLFSGSGFKVGTKTLPEAFITKGTRVQDIPSRLKNLAEQARTSSVARAEFAKQFKPYQLKVGKGVQPFGYPTSPESEFIVASGGIVKTTGQIGKIYVPGATTYARLYDLSIPTTKEIVKKAGVQSADDLLSAATKSYTPTSYSTIPIYSTSRLASEIGLTVATTTKPLTDKKEYTPLTIPKISDDFYSKNIKEPIQRISTTSDVDARYSPLTIKTSVSRSLPLYDKRQIPYIPISRTTYDSEIDYTPQIDMYDRTDRNVKSFTFYSPSSKTYTPYNTLLENITRTLPPRDKKRKEKERVEVKKDIPYETYVREKGKWNRIDIDNKKRNKYAAMALGAKVADETVARSWKIKKGRGKKVDIKRRTKPILSKFYRMSKTQDPKLAGAWIEKSAHAIDSPGEMKGITAKGWEKQQKKKFVKNYLGGSRKPNIKLKKTNKQSIKIKPPKIKSVI